MMLAPAATVTVWLFTGACAIAGWLMLITNTTNTIPKILMLFIRSSSFQFVYEFNDAYDSPRLTYIIPSFPVSICLLYGRGGVAAGFAASSLKDISSAL